MWPARLLGSPTGAADRAVDGLLRQCQPAKEGARGLLAGREDVMTRWCEPVRSAGDVAALERSTTFEGLVEERSVHDVFRFAAIRQPGAVALTMLVAGTVEEQPRTVTYAELAGLVNRAGNAFVALAGPRPGVAYMLPSLVETHAVLWGAQSAGYAVPLNFLLNPEHLADLVRAADAAVLVTLGPHPALDLWQKAEAVAGLVPGLKVVALNMPGLAPAEGALDLAALMADQPADRLLIEPGRDDEVAAYFHTGGTTGDPKLVTLTHRSQLLAALGGALLGDMGSGDVLAATLPLFHAGGTVFCGLSPLLAGAELLIMTPSALRSPTVVRNFWALLDRHAVTLAGAVPTGLAAVVDVPVGEADLSRVRAGFTGASPIPSAIQQRFEAMTGARLHQVYGMTESSGILSIDPVAGAGAPGTVGINPPWMRLEVLRQGPDGSLREVAATDEIGVVVAHGPHVSPGYRNAVHDAGVLTDRTLVTGDLGYRDEAGNLVVAGRVKDLIIRSGHNIDPVMIEDAMVSHPAVAMAAAVGQPDAYAGELPVVYLALRPDASASVEELHEHARATIAERPAWPREIYILDALPMTSVGKLFKPDLRVDATRRLVEDLLSERLGARLPVPPPVEVSLGGTRGTRVSVTVPDDELAGEVQTLLSAHLFETVVLVRTVAATDTPT
ncbi:AMP-binding protein [Nocardioides sp. CGMCC 1.13656]|nr:AMP-binding protein [Nocardioides sp. CGMCC 1.13656]MBA2953317.1 AMP-binding protein [Nocardioides sp. CGMCC 1.13656]